MSSLLPPLQPGGCLCLESDGGLELLDELCSKLADNDPAITVLDLRRWVIDNDSARALGAALRKNSVLQEFLLVDIKIGSQGLDLIAQGLAGNASLKELGSIFTELGNEGAAVLANRLLTNNTSTLKELRFYKGENIGDDGMRAIAEGLATNSSLEVLHLWNDSTFCIAGIEALGKALKVNVTLKELSLRSNKLLGCPAESLFDGLKHNTGLESLCLDENLIGKEGALALKSLLRLNTNLKNISLADNFITNSGAVDIAEGLKENHTLEELQLQHNDISIEGLEALEEALQSKNRTLKKLTLREKWDFNSENQEKRELIHFYCELNCSGRRLIGDPHIPFSLWPRILAKLETKPWSRGQLFWFLREKPELMKQSLQKRKINEIQY